MARDITVTFDDDSQHVYQGAPDNITPADIESRAQKDFGKKVKALDGGRRAAPEAPKTESQRPLETRIPSNVGPKGEMVYPAPAAAPPAPEQAPEKPSLMSFLTGAPRQGMPQAPGMGAVGAGARAMVAPVETAAALGTGATTGFLGGLLSMGNRIAQQVTGIVQGKTADEIKAGGPSTEEAFTQGMQAGTYSPRTPEAQAQTEAIGGALQEHGPALMGLGPELAALGKGVGAAARSPLPGQVKALPGKVVEAAVPRISPERAANVQAGMEQGLTFAPHQLADNKFVKMAGETAESVPGSFGKMRREERQSAFTQALAKQINPEAEGVVKLTPDVLAEAMDRSGGKIGEITGKTAIPIEDVQGSLDTFRRRLGRTTEDQQRVAGGYVDEFERIAAENGGQIPGENFKNLNSELGAQIRANAGNPLGNLLGELQDHVLDAFRERLSAEDRAAYDTSRAEYAKAKTILPLVAKAVEGDISPGSLMQAVNATKSGKNAMALGYAGQLGDLARAGKYLTEAKSSGTAERNLVHQFILDPIKSTVKVATAYPAAAAYNLAGPAITRAMVRKGLKGAPEALPAGEVPPAEPAPPAGGPGPGTPPAGPVPDPRLAEIAKLRESATSDAVHKALDAHEKTVLADIKAKATEAKKVADVAELEKAAQATQDPALRKTLQDQADKLRGGKLPTGEATELATTPTPKPEKVGKIPVGQTIEGQPEIGITPPSKVPAGEATEITPEVIAPEEPIPVGEATEITPVSNRPTGEVVSNRPKAEPVSNKPTAETGAPIVNNEPVSDYSHGALYKAAEVAGIETRGRRPSEVRAAFERSWAKEHGLNPMDAERARNVAKALDVDAQAVENAAVQHERSPRMFDREIDRIIEQGMSHAPETNQAARSGESPATNPAGGEASARAGRGGNAESGAQRAVGDEGDSRAGRAAGAVEAPVKQPGADRAATTGTERQGDQPSGSSKANGVDRQGNPYAVSVKREDFGAGPDKAKSVLVEARDPETGARRGFVDFAVREDGVLVAENAKVAPEFKKRGIAEMMYKAARDAGHDIAPGRVQTDEGAAMVESLQKKGLINKESDAPRFKAGDLDLVPIEGETIPGEKASRPEAPIEAIPETELETRVPGKKQWNITIKSKTSGRTREVAMPGGLSEAEAARGAVLKAGNDWMVSRQELGTSAPKGFEKGATKPTEATPAVHKDPGQPVEPVTPKVVTAAVQKNAKPAQAREALLKSVDEAIGKAVSDAHEENSLALARYPSRKPAKEEVRRYMVDNGLRSLADAEEKMAHARERSAQANLLDIAERIGYVTFKVPGDGEFKVINSKSRLEEFRSAVEKSPGFATSRTKTAPENAGVHRGSGSTASAIANMVDEGDFQAAHDYAVAKGIDPEAVKLDPKPAARFKAWLKENPRLD